MNMDDDKVNVNFPGLIAGLGLFIVILIYALPALSSRNPLWFLANVETDPSQIVTYDNGTRTVYLRTSPGYQTLAPLCVKALKEVSGLDDSGLSDATFNDIRDHGKAVEIFFPQPITIPTTFPVGKPNQIFIPLDDKYADWSLFYTGNDGHYWAQGLRIHSTYGQIKAAFDSLTPGGK